MFICMAQQTVACVICTSLPKAILIFSCEYVQSFSSPYLFAVYIRNTYALKLWVPTYTMYLYVYYKYMNFARALQWRFIWVVPEVSIFILSIRNESIDTF